MQDPNKLLIFKDLMIYQLVNPNTFSTMGFNFAVSYFTYPYFYHFKEYGFPE
jgi:hypothetical protein